MLECDTVKGLNAKHNLHYIVMRLRITVNVYELSSHQQQFCKNQNLIIHQ